MRLTNRSVGPAFPWVTAAFAVMAVVVQVWPAAHEPSLYARSAILGGEWWRLFTGNFAHFGLAHLAWNLAVLVPTGIWLERRWPRPGRRFMLMSPWAIGLALLIFEPRLEVYAGLSGVVIGLVALLGLQLRRNSPADRWWANALLLLVLIKLAAEGVKGGPLFARFADHAIGVVFLAHLAGVGSALLYWALEWRRNSSGLAATTPGISGGEPPSS